MMMTIERKYMTVSKLAQRLGCSVHVIYNAIHDGRLAAHRVGARTLRIPESAADAYMKACRVDPGAE